jgi:hypothetical protein
MVNKEYLEDLYQCIEQTVGFLSSVIELYIENSDIKEVIKEKLNGISFYIKRVYDLELIELKQKARMHYQTWLHLKDIDSKTAQFSYFEYLDTKRKIELIETPY